jgi:hypothetical protein
LTLTSDTPDAAPRTDGNWEPVFVGPWSELENASRSIAGLERKAGKDVTREDASREA